MGEVEGEVGGCVGLEGCPEGVLCCFLGGGGGGGWCRGGGGCAAALEKAGEVVAGDCEVDCFQVPRLPGGARSPLRREGEGDDNIPDCALDIPASRDKGVDVPPQRLFEERGGEMERRGAGIEACGEEIEERRAQGRRETREEEGEVRELPLPLCYRVDRSIDVAQENRSIPRFLVSNLDDNTPPPIPCNLIHGVSVIRLSSSVHSFPSGGRAEGAHCNAS